MKITRRSLLRGGLAGFAVGASAAAYARLIEPRRLDLTTTRITLPGWSYHRSIKAGHLSDFHCVSRESFARTRAAVSLLLQEQPEVVFLTGDYVTGHPEKWAPRCAEALAPLAGVPFGAYAILGNHDWWSGGPRRVTSALNDVGIRVLRNRSMALHQTGLWIVGLDDAVNEKTDVDAALETVPPKASRILLVHEPDFADEAPAGFALQLSGHSHGGQVCLPGGRPITLPAMGRKYPRGLQRSANHQLFVTRGIGMMWVQCRLFCPPEVSILRLHPENSA